MRYKDLFVFEESAIKCPSFKFVHYWLRITNSVRLFLARPASVSLVSTGTVYP